ncbi:MAG TPA: SNF2-related protein, partial [Actinomycetales bacterium]|nr:SNF2-related protein [Actinomycetales bacterium]
MLRAIYAAQLSRRGGYYAYDTPVHLDDLGPSLWRLLAQATDAGLELVSPKASAGPVVVADAATVCLDLRRASPSSGATLDPLVTIGTHTLEAAGVDLLGDPAHGLFVTDPGELASITGTEELTPSLLLAALDERPDEHVAGLLRAGQGLEIPAPDLPRFLQVYYPGLRRAVTVTSTDDSVDLPEVLPPRLALTVTFRPDNAVSLEWGYAYQVADGVACLPLDGAGDGAGGDGVDGVARDLRAEQGLLDDLDAPTRRLVRPALSLTGMDAVTFTQDVLPTLRDSDDVRLTVVGEPPEFRHAQTPPVVHLSTTDSDDTDWYDLAVAVSIEGEEIPFDEMFVALAGAQTHMVLASGTYFSLARPELEQLRSLIEEARALADRESDGLRLSVYQAGLWEELAELGVVEQQSERWANAVQGLLGVSELVPPALPTGFDADLRPYQVDGYHWLAFLWQHGLGGILADDMGLGKTVQTLAMFCHAREAGETPEPFLVVAPTSVVGNWEREAARFAPGLKVRTVTETVGRRGTPLAEDVAGADLVVTSYALFRIDFDSYQGVAWAGLVLDEAQFVKNHQAKTYQCARRLQVPFKLAITGTPLENSLMDLWSLLSIVAPGLFPSPQRFTEFYRRPIERGTDPALLATLRRRIRPLMRRRTKEQV